MINMIKRTGWTMALAVSAWVGAGGLAEASCADSTILLAVPGTVIGEAVPVVWTVEPACPVIETGLLLGDSPTALAPVGQPIYAVRPPYRLELAVPESGSYWIAAWARDEEGVVLQAAAQQVLVIMPPPVPGEPTGSHSPGARDPASYTGTDADFLRPAASAADPRHFASLRFAFRENQQRDEFRRTGEFFSLIFANTGRSVGSTHPDEVRAEQRQPFTLLGEPEPVQLEPVTPGGVGVDVVLAQQDGGFRFFPRPGFYAVGCGVSVDFPFGFTSRRTCALGSFFNPLPTAFGLSYQSVALERVTSFSPNTSTSESRRAAGSSRVTYFLPAAPPGQRVARAMLRVFVQGIGDLSQIRLSGKAPATSEVVSCVEAVFGVNFCQAWLTWDFTAEAQAAASQGGSLLDLTLDPSPPATLTSPSPTDQVSGSNALYFFSVRLDYPWLHGLSPDNRLVVTFTEACPQTLEVKLDRRAVLPEIPSDNVVPAPIRNLPTKATVTATVKTCPSPGGSPPASVEVMLQVRRPTESTPEAGGHAHNTTRPTGTLRVGPGEVTRCFVTTFDTEGMGSCEVTYHASEVSGVETIVASATGFTEAQAKITVEVPGLGVPNLVELPDAPEKYARVGTPNNHAGTNDPCTPQTDAPKSQHFEAFFGQPALIKVVEEVAATMLQQTGILLRVNDMSLPLGGLFDFNNNWITPHLTHRVGRHVDLQFSGIRNGVCTGYDIERLRTVIRTKTGNLPVEHTNHFHAFIP